MNVDIIKRKKNGEVIYELSVMVNAEEYKKLKKEFGN